VSSATDQAKVNGLVPKEIYTVLGLSKVTWIGTDGEKKMADTNFRRRVFDSGESIKIG
jgi:hypothetical protein